MEGKAEPIEIQASTPRFSRLFASVLFDAFTLLFLTALLCLGTFATYFSLPVYREPTSFREETMLASGIYEKKDSGVSLISSSLKEDGGLTYLEKRAKTEEALSRCYLVFLDEELGGKGKQTLDGYCSSYLLDGKPMFDGFANRLFPSSDYERDYFEAYCDVLENRAVGDLDLKEGFREARKSILIGYFLSFLIAFSLSCFVLLLLVPLCFSKGKRTFGMALTKLAYLDAFGLSPSWKRMTLRFLFQWILILCGTFFTFGATLIFSACFSAYRKDHQSVSDYVFALYPVDASSTRIHESAEELFPDLPPQGDS